MTTYGPAAVEPSWGLSGRCPGASPDDGPAYQRFSDLLEFYTGTVRRVPAYQPIGADGLRALVCGAEPGGTP